MLSPSFLRRLKTLLFPGRASSELEDELAAHLEFQTRMHLAAGRTEVEARRLAHLEFGSTESIREETREGDRWVFVDAILRNLRFSVRFLSKSPGFTAIAILILAAAIGSNLAVFATMDAMLFRPLPVENPSELVRISLVGKKGDLLEMPSTALGVLQANHALAGICGFDTSLLGVEINGDRRSIGVAGFTGECFGTLGLPLALGRALRPDDNRLGASPVAVITDSLWHSTFHSRPDILGQTFQIGASQINPNRYTIVGVTRKPFTGLLLGFPQEIILPLLQCPDVLDSGIKPTYYWVSVLARRAQGVSESQVRASVLTQSKQLLEASVPYRYNLAQRADYLSRKVTVLSGRSGIDYFLRNRFGQPLYAICSICAALLLIAAVNLTSLLLARGLKRKREVAVRLALGAKPANIAALFASEGAVLLTAGAAAGVLGGLWVARLLLSRGDTMFSNFRLDTGLDTRVLIFLLALLGLVLAMFAGASIWQARRLTKHAAWKDSGRGVVGSHSFPQQMLVGLQVALTLAFVAASALFTGSLRNMYSIHLGIDPKNVWEVELAERPNNFDPTGYYRTLLQQIKSLPDVESVSITDSIPFLNWSYQEPVAAIDTGRNAAEVQARELGAADGFFGALGARLLAGEDFRREDTHQGEPTAIVSESLARRFGNARDLIGHHIRVGANAEYARVKVIGVASDTDLNLADLDDQKPFTVYLNFWQHRDLQFYPVLLIKTRDGQLPIAAIRRLVKAAGHEYIDRATTIDQEIDTALVENRLVAWLSDAFGGLALIMAAVGLFGILNYHVTTRTAEIGIRVALGAERWEIQWLVLRPILRLLVLGGLAGIALTLALGKVMSGLLYGVNPYDARLLVFSGGVLAAVALVAAWVPIRRASGVDPLEALRHE